MRKENKGRLTGGVNTQGNMEGNAHKDPKSALENNAKKSNTKR
ncbi:MULTISPECIES: small, acid-soluble spore protein L [Bacillus]|nr:MULTISPECIES: small, acid-soluble spore protein L [Bacillus]MBL3612324.1 small, acid-soluble spore protein L [Bacillus sp. RHFS18]KAF6546967.1 small, acid-soluble spore protein L [Bacillus sp. EKM207B]KAF6548345.1 small, acid-soluble spore protein L [Bacillus sp. EKM206B]KAF6555366.1 small, acid-soluble spore protein L [Bacillus sp. EKM203B]KSV98026.1 small, acid-soluble spore protein L [Bacillus velezensis]